MSAESGAKLIAAERQRQIDAEGWTPEHDDQHSSGELAYAAMAYADPKLNIGMDSPLFWPWERQWWRPDDDPVRNLVKAGALIAAEIDRIQRLSERNNGGAK